MAVEWDLMASLHRPLWDVADLCISESSHRDKHGEGWSIMGSLLDLKTDNWECKLTVQRCLRMSGMAVEWGPMASLYRRMLEVMDCVNQNRLMLVSSSSLLMQASSSPSTHRHIVSMIQATRNACQRE